MNIVRFINQNRKKFRMAIIIIASFIIGIQFLNYNAVRESQKYIQDTNQHENVSSNNSKISSSKSGTTGQSISETQLYGVEKLIDKFFEYCNKKDFENAYQMLTDECKKALYNNLEEFVENYYNNMFNGVEQTYSLQNWNGNIYIVTITEDALSTGKTSSKKLDYITVVDNKLNISGFIGENKIEKQSTQNNISIKVESKEVFMDNEIYKITISNKSENTICLGDIEDSESICIRDSNEHELEYYNHEFLEDDLVIKSGFTVELDVKFYSSYVSTKQIKYIIFKNLFLDYENDKSKSTVFYIEL